ncbi:Aliphatic sulfonates import ATP-binding protein SsuB [Hartmannibacter diazotrophicus]|uniref:Aliphatic sulfonates import ATP-binding protein SsuB n=2 Tax=Hartmannibacter diazotrophicus TaxID=1482074 RepID=A0A2C9D995_9HYPH|nr:Aliphatic sulfonates import ATP-binding protein SsuB [Hartmannibacter diazotrophicus]
MDDPTPEVADQEAPSSGIAKAQPEVGPPLVEMVNVWKRFGQGAGETVALAGVDLAIQPGEFVTLIGPSGCGKSTLFNMIAGLTDTDSDGSVVFKNKPQRDGELLGKVSFMPQKDLLFAWRTVLDNATLALEIEGVPRAKARARAEAMFPEFGLAGFEKHYPHQLSGGMRQRVALMRTFLFERELMLLDEPFGALDALTRAMMQRWLLEIWEKHRRTVLFITHDIDEAIFLGDKVVVMTARPGRIKTVETIDLPRPRGAEVITSPEFIEIKRRLLGIVEEESLKSFASAGAS